MKSASIQALRAFPPGTLIEIDRSRGGRMLAEVLEDGLAHVDLADPRASCPVDMQLHPRDAGNPLAWSLYLVQESPAEHSAYRRLLDNLRTSGYDSLTIARAARWALDSRCYDANAAIAEALAQTEQARKSLLSRRESAWMV